MKKLRKRCKNCYVCIFSSHVLCVTVPKKFFLENIRCFHYFLLTFEINLSLQDTPENISLIWTAVKPWKKFSEFLIHLKKPQTLALYLHLKDACSSNGFWKSKWINFLADIDRLRLMLINMVFEVLIVAIFFQW